MEHFLDRSQTVTRWNQAIPPRLTINSGDRVVAETHEATGGQVQADMNAKDYAQVDRNRVHALTGPIAITGAEPGDRLVIRFEDFAHEGWAWTSIVPGRGLLDEFDQHYLFHWTLEGNQTRSIPGVTLDLAPFCGIVGVPRPEAGEFRTQVPGIFGGNMDVKHLTAGAELELPVLVPGGLICLGDTHAAQGDGEVSLNGMEAPMKVTFSVELRKNTPLDAPLARVPGDLVPPRYREKPFHVFIASGEDPRELCKEVVRRAIDYLRQRLGLSSELAYVLCSVVLDLKISQLVNSPAMTVSGYLPEAIFDQPAKPL